MNVEYELHGSSVDALNARLDEFWKDLKRDDALRNKAREVGFDIAASPEVVRTDAVKVSVNEAYFDPATTAIIVAFAPVAAKIAGKVAEDLWTKVIVPWIEWKMGPGKLRPTRKK